MNSKYLIIADDFTGANDTGVQMAKKGIPVKIILSSINEKNDLSFVLDTETRNLKPTDAYKKTKKILNSILNSQNFSIIYKKIDSTLRGNIIEEIRAIDELYKPDKIVFAPAYPDIKRTTKNKIHYVNNEPLMKTEFSKDPLSPTSTDNIVKLLEEGFKEKIKHHTIEDIRCDMINLDDARIYTFDSLESNDLKLIAKRFLEVNEKILWIGSAGLAEAIFNTLHQPKPVLATIGSISETALNQIEYAKENSIRVLKINSKDLFDKSKINDYTEIATDILKSGSDLILTAAENRNDYEDTVEFGYKKNISSNTTSYYIQIYLAKITSKVLREIEVSGLYLTGGATAISIIDELNATGATIKKEILKGTVYSILDGGTFGGLKIVTKAGAFGDQNNIIDALNYIKES